MSAEDEEVISDLTELQNVEDKIEEAEKRREEKIRLVEKEFNKELRPLYDERIKACAKIKGFWVNTMLNHPQLKDLVSQNDEDCLMHLNEVDVQEIDDDKFQGHRYVFRFAANSYFDNKEIFKEFKYTKETGDIAIDQTNIKWKPGMNLCSPSDVSKMLSGKQAGKKRPHDETSGFFSWFDRDNEDEEFIGQPMKEIWEEPVKFFAGDVDDDYGDDYDDDEDDDDDDDQVDDAAAGDDGEDDEGEEDDDEGEEGEE